MCIYFHTVQLHVHVITSIIMPQSLHCERMFSIVQAYLLLICGMAKYNYNVHRSQLGLTVMLAVTVSKYVLKYVYIQLYGVT